jgi:TolA-binding protein
VFNTKRIGAALAVLAGMGVPAAAVAARGQEGKSGGSQQIERPKQTKPAVRSKLLERPSRRLRETIHVQVHQLRSEARRDRAQAYADLPGGVSQATLDAIGACESGGDPSAVSSDGTYRGKYQFDYGTWASLGGSGDPAAAPEAEQDYRAALLYAQSGSSPWPICAA